MKKSNFLLLLLLTIMIQPLMAQPNSKKELDWKLGVQAYTFKNFTFTEALEKINSIDLEFVEAYPGQEIGNGIEVPMHYEMDVKTRKKVKNLLTEIGGGNCGLWRGFR